MNLVKTYLDKDNYEGIGLFAAEFIPKGTLIWNFNSFIDRKYNLSQFNYLLNNNPITITDYLKRYTFGKEGDIYFCGDDAKYCNHSKNPNTQGYPEQYASKDIEIGEEITCDYSTINDDFSEDEFDILKSYK